MIKRLGLPVLAVLGVIGGSAAIAGFWNVVFPIVGGGSYCGSTVNNVCGLTIPAGPVVLTGAETVLMDTNLPNGQNPQTVIAPTALLMPSYQNPRNLLDNGAMAVQQRGTGIVTCAANAAITSAAYSADRWGCSANVAVGAGRSQVTTTTPAPPVGFQASERLYRTSGALLQPVCAIQEVPSVASTEVAGKTVTLSFQAQALAGLSADNGNLINAVIITGTGNAEGFGTMTASPAITPAWTGLATAINQSFTITTGWVRYSVTVALPATETEIGVLLCFTPTATGAGTTDGFAFTGVQLEVAPSPTQYEFRPYYDELVRAYHYFYRITESASVLNIRAPCTMSTSSIANCLITFPVTMRVAPTMTYTAGFEASATTASTSATVCTALTTTATLTGNAASLNNVLIDCASSAGFGAAGTGGFLWDIGTGSASGVISASADF